MKQIRRRLTSGLYTLPFLLFVYLLIVAASLLLAVNGFDGVFSADLFNSSRGILLLVVGPLGILVFLSLFLYGIISESIHLGAGNRLRLRLFLILLFLLFSATFPQTVIVSRYVSTALGSWFSQSVSGALESASKYADLYSAERLHLMENVSSRYFNALTIGNYRKRPTEWMSEIQQLDANAVSCQVYLEQSDSFGLHVIPIVEIGNSAEFVPSDALDRVKNGLFVFREGESLYRFGQIVRYSNNTYICIYTSKMSEGFLAGLEQIRTARKQSEIIDTLKPFLPLMGIWIYLMFSLPSILMVVILSWYFSSRVTEPVSSIAEAAARLAEGDDTFIVLPHSSDELSDTALLLNSVAHGYRANKKKDKRVVIKLKDGKGGITAE